MKRLWSRRSLATDATAAAAATPTAGKGIRVTFRNSDRAGAVLTVQATLGDTLLETAWKAGLKTVLEGACDHCLVCSTCQVRIEDTAWRTKLEPPSDEELDMIDLAHEPSESSRLACQIIVSKSLNGLEVTVPTGVLNRLKDHV